MKKPFSSIRNFFSFSKLLRNDKLMVIVSLIIAAFVWFNVISGPANITERSVEMDVSVDLTGSYAYQSGLRIIGDSDFTVKVKVSGPWATLVKLDENDLRVRADMTAITRDGVNDVPLNVSRNSTVTDYDILSVLPSTVQITCEYWKQGTLFQVEVDTSGVLVEDPETAVVGEAVLDTADFQNGAVTIDGPENVVESIERIVAVVETKQPLKKQQQFEVPLVAYDRTGREVDISACEIREIPNGKVLVTVPLWERRTLNVNYLFDNLPSNVVDTQAFIEKYITVEPSSVLACGTEKSLDSAQKQLDLGAIDFEDLISAESMELKYEADIPNESGEEEPVTVTVGFNAGPMQSLSLTVTPTEENVRFVDDSGQDITSRVMGLYKVTVPEGQKPLNLSLIGNTESVSGITADDFVWKVKLGSPIDPNAKDFPASVTVDGYDDVWILGEKQLGEYRMVIELASTRALTTPTA